MTGTVNRCDVPYSPETNYGSSLSGYSLVGHLPDASFGHAAFFVPTCKSTDVVQTYFVYVEDYHVGTTQLYLIDNYQSQSAPLYPGMSYSFNVTSDPQSKGDNRFQIGIRTTSVTTVAGSEVSLSLASKPAVYT